MAEVECTYPVSFLSQQNECVVEPIQVQLCWYF